MAIDLGDTLAVARSVVGALETLRIEYYLGGSIASSIHGEARLTQDLDFVAQMSVAQIPAFVAHLGERFYADSEMIREAIQLKSSCNVIDFPVGIKADIFFPSIVGFTESEFARKIRAPISSLPDSPEAYICSAEDIVLQKLLWYKMGGGVSDRQWRDVLGVLIYQAGNLDNAYMDRWAREIEVSDLLARAREDAERPWNPH